MATTTTTTTTTTTAAAAATAPTTPYSWTEPANSEKLRWTDHFSSLLFGGSWQDTLLELALLAIPLALWAALGSAADVAGSMGMLELAAYFWANAVVRRVYNAYLEGVWFAFPKYRTQPPREHKLKKVKDLCGRELKQLEELDWHNKVTAITQFALNMALYYGLPGYYPAALADGETPQPIQERFLRLILNHYVMSFGMYWSHRSLHDVPYLWDKIHSIHHWAKHPLSRNTYEDHWADNFGNAIVGHVFAQIMVPLDRETFWFSHLFRILESLEKHSGVSCRLNLAHALQQWLPFAQMPHHHDWHHEGHKGCNYTFSSMGGIWDVCFGTRKNGRHGANGGAMATRRDSEISQRFVLFPACSLIWTILFVYH